MSFSERLKQAMEYRNFRQVDLVMKTKINKGTISNYLSGKYEPKMVNTILIAEALDINPLWLLGHDDVSMENDPYVDYLMPKNETESATVFEFEEGFEKEITKEKWASYYDSIMLMSEPLRLEIFKYVTMVVFMSEMQGILSKKIKK